MKIRITQTKKKLRQNTQYHKNQTELKLFWENVIMQTSSEITKVRFHTSPILCGRIETRSISFFLFFLFFCFYLGRWENHKQTNKHKHYVSVYLMRALLTTSKEENKLQSFSFNEAEQTTRFHGNVWTWPNWTQHNQKIIHHITGVFNF